MGTQVVLPAPKHLPEVNPQQHTTQERRKSDDEVHGKISESGWAAMMEAPP
jgi:hypothetical protein